MLIKYITCACHEYMKSEPCLYRKSTGQQFFFRCSQVPFHKRTSYEYLKFGSCESLAHQWEGASGAKLQPCPTERN